jgi:hypothetical protein
MNFKNIDYKSVKILYDLCKKSQQNDIDLIRYLYNSNASNFHENLSLCKLIGLIIEKENKLFCSDENTDFEQLIIQKLKKNRNSLGPLTVFMNKFSFENGDYVYHISNQDKIVFMWERYFLDDLNLTVLKNNVIIFNSNYSDLLTNKKLSVEDLKRIAKEKERIGAMAEQFVISYESEKLLDFPHMPHDCVKQVSINFANAGYDIESFDKESAKKNIYEKIFIEVKCVNNDYLFYWSRNEIQKAEGLRTKYFLYLVPSNFSGVGLKIIQDPFVNILNNKHWLCETEQLQIRENNFG